MAPDKGYKVCSCSHAGKIYIWEEKTLNLVATVEAHTGNCTSAQWHPTEPFIASGGHDKNLVITNAATKERVVTVPLSDLNSSSMPLSTRCCGTSAAHADVEKKEERQTRK